MASTNDARDILDAKVDDRPRPVKKQKTGVVRPSLSTTILVAIHILTMCRRDEQGTIWTLW